MNILFYAYIFKLNSEPLKLILEELNKIFSFLKYIKASVIINTNLIFYFIYDI